jgi:CHAT domain-containing protein
MSTSVGALRLSLAWIAGGGPLALLLVLLLAACGSGTIIPRQVLSTTCRPVGGPRATTVNIASPDAGLLRIKIAERGVSVIVSLDDDLASAAASPVERAGTIVLVTPTTPGGSHSVHVLADDSPDITAEFCVDAYLISASDPVRAAAEESFAAAGRAVRAKSWEGAFGQYLDAARRFDRLHLTDLSAAARQAMAELAYLRLDRKRDGLALVSEARAEYGPQVDPIFAGLLLGLQAKILLDTPGIDPHIVAPQVRELLAAARRYDRASRFGVRELPRLDIMTGFIPYILDAPDAAARALETFTGAAQTCRAMRDWDCYAIASQNLATLAYEGKNYATAMSEFGDVLRLLPSGLDPKLSADIWDNYGLVQGLLGLFTSSERSHAIAMREYAGLGDCAGVRRSLAHSGDVMVQIGTIGDAESNLQQAVSLDCHDLVAIAAGKAVSDRGQPLPASAVAMRANLNESLAPQGGPCTQPLDPDTLTTDNKLIVFDSLLSLEDAMSLQGEPALAKRCLDAAGHYAATARTQMRLANARGDAFLESQDADAARKAFEQSMQIADDAKISPGYEYRGVARLGLVRSSLLAGNLAGAVLAGLQTLQASVSRGDIDQTVTSLRLLAAGYRESGQLGEAAHTLQTAADLVEAIPIDDLDGEKRATYLATQYNVFAELTDLYASQADKDPAMASLAFATSERGRARSLRYAVTQARADATGNSSVVGPAPATRYQHLLQEVVSLTTPGRGLLSQALIEDLDQAALRERSPATALDERQLRLALSQLHAVLLEYAVGAHDMFAFMVDDRGLEVVRLGDRRKISVAASELQDRLRDAETPEREVGAAAARLAALVLWPVSDRLVGKRILVVPDDGLHTVPFNVLPWSGKTADSLVLQHAEVSIVPSALFLTNIHAMNPQRTSAPRIELIGDPVFRVSDWHRECSDVAARPVDGHAIRAISDWTESLPRLPGSRSEVQMIARLAQQSRPGSHIESFLGCAAVPTALRQAATGRVDLLHIATHARVDSQRPRLSALALTPERGTDALFSAFGLLDILGLKLNSSLVVLSACETSRGRLLPGEGVLGPAQAFLQAGAATVLASYWRIDDQSTSRFMQQFYRYLLTEHLPASTALRRAQLDQATSSPVHDWAAFSLYGWPDSAL